MGGPNGGDGGSGDLAFFADPQMSTLLDFKFQRFYRAENGEPGKPELSTGRSSKAAGDSRSRRHHRAR